jgi:hypothetical protein
MLVLLIMCVAAIITARVLRYLSGQVAVKMGYTRLEGQQALASAGLSLVAKPKQD